MKSGQFFLFVLCLIVMPVYAMAMPTVYPTGVTVYKPEKTWDGFTLIGPSWWDSGNSTYLVDMNGKVVKEWDKLLGHSAKMLPGGMVQGQYGERKKAYLNILDFDGNIVRKKPVLSKYSVEVLMSNSNITCQKAQEKLGYRPRPLSKTIRDMVRWHRAARQKV